MNNTYSWLQLSDLHIFESTDWNIMLDSYSKLAEVIKPDFLIITGDYRHKKHNTDYTFALKFLNKLVEIFKINKSDVFLVPGNHDVNDYHLRNEIITTINESINTNPDIYYNYMNDNTTDLRNAFAEYHSFVKQFYGDEVNDDRIKEPASVINVCWKNKLNIIILNTSLASQGKPEKEIVDIRTLSELKINKQLPSIALAHHSIDSLTDSHKNKLITLLNNLGIRAYFCGDEHKLNKKSVDKHDITNSTFPVFVCGKSAIETTDKFSDLCVIEYKCEHDGKAYVQVYRYIESNFIQANDFYYNINKRFDFLMYEKCNTRSGTRKRNKNQECDSNLEQMHDIESEESKPNSIWLPDAELAQGKQTRFNSFTKTDSISCYFDPKSEYLGIVSAKGIGKTFVLQVKRIKSARRFYCLPKCSIPSVKNNWATERVSFDKYSQLKTNNIYDDLVVLWKIAIKCYVINHFMNPENSKTIEEYVRNKKISSDVASLCTDEHNDSLEAILQNAVNIQNWNVVLSHDSINVGNICKIVLRRRKSEADNTKNKIRDIAIFIDKVDQAIRQTNAEPPADCVVCKKRNNYNECESPRKSTSFCTDINGCQSKNCCYGCEVFASPKSSDGLRIYEDSNAAKLVHINIWQYLQLALMNAANQLSDELKGEINVFYTIRQEAFNCEETLLGEHNQKIAGKIIHLSYTVEEQKKIFLDCIKEQNPLYLFDASLKDKEGSEEYAFVGVNGLCHPYCLNTDGTHINESIFMCIYRHSFDRSRDIQRYGRALTNEIDTIKNINNEKERGEHVKKIIEDMAASLAYRSRKTESTVNPSYYTEKMRYLPNYWADNDNFENLLSLIDRNLLFEDDVKRICRVINGHDICPSSGCRGGNCKRHPFSMLYNMGYLGYIMPSKNTNVKEVQQFLDSSNIGYFVEEDHLITADRVAYIIHPALTKTIERHYNKSFMHFSGFILGKGLHVETSIVLQMLEDKKKLNNDEFLNKYYYKP